jgi:hypothetical protein
MATKEKRIEVPMTTQQKAALRREALRRDMDVAELIRKILYENVLDYPDNMPSRGKYLRRKNKMLRYYVKALAEYNLGEIARMENIEEYEVEYDDGVVEIVAPKDYELTTEDLKGIDDLLAAEA